MAINFFKKHAWQPGEVDWHYLILFENQPKVNSMARQYIPLLNHEGLHSPIPLEWLHLTILRVGSVVDINEEEMKKVNSQIYKEAKGIVTKSVEVGPAWLWSGSVCLHVTPEEELKKLHSIVFSATHNVLKNKAPKPDKFIPHITLAYPKDTYAENEMRKQLQRKWIEPASFKPSELCLVKQQQTPPYYQWNIEHRIKL